MNWLFTMNELPDILVAFLEVIFQTMTKKANIKVPYTQNIFLNFKASYY